jgi:hypothetical protein
LIVFVVLMVLVVVLSVAWSLVFAGFVDLGAGFRERDREFVGSSCE